MDQIFPLYSPQLPLLMMAALHQQEGILEFAKARGQYTKEQWQNSLSAPLLFNYNDIGWKTLFSYESRNILNLQTALEALKKIGEFSLKQWREILNQPFQGDKHHGWSPLLAAVFYNYSQVVRAIYVTGQYTVEEWHQLCRTPGKSRFCHESLTWKVTEGSDTPLSFAKEYKRHSILDLMGEVKRKIPVFFEDKKEHSSTSFFHQTDLSKRTLAPPPFPSPPMPPLSEAKEEVEDKERKENIIVLEDQCFSKLPIRLQEFLAHQAKKYNKTAEEYWNNPLPYSKEEEAKLSVSLEVLKNRKLIEKHKLIDDYLNLSKHSDFSPHRLIPSAPDKKQSHKEEKPDEDEDEDEDAADEEKNSDIMNAALSNDFDLLTTLLATGAKVKNAEERSKLLNQIIDNGWNEIWETVLTVEIDQAESREAGKPSFR